MVQGLGSKQIAQRIKTESKIVAFLNLQEFGFNELQSISGIRRDSLRNRLDSLVDRKIVSKHIIKDPTGRKNPRGEFHPRVRRGTYYSLNSDSSEAKHLLDLYYNDILPPPPPKLKKELVDSFKKFCDYIDKERDKIIRQADIFKKEIEPLLATHEPDKSLYLWADSIKLSRHYTQLMIKHAKIFAIRARLRLDSVDKKK
jgi:hypothetical protein